MTKKIDLKKIIILSTAIISGFLFSFTLTRCGSPNKILSEQIKYQNRESSEPTLSLLQSGNINISNRNNDTYYYSFNLTIQNQENDLFSITNTLNYNLSLIIDFNTIEYVDLIVNGDRFITFDDMREPFIVDITTNGNIIYVELKAQGGTINGQSVTFQLIASKNNTGEGYQEGYDAGYELGKSQGEEIGYIEGYDQGVIAGGNINSVEWLKNTFSAVADVLTIEPFPGLSFATILSIPLIVTVVQFILGWFI